MLKAGPEKLEIDWADVEKKSSSAEGLKNVDTIAGVCMGAGRWERDRSGASGSARKGVVVCSGGGEVVPDGAFSYKLRAIMSMAGLGGQGDLVAVDWADRQPVGC
jgi:hypothetical protein